VVKILLKTPLQTAVMFSCFIFCVEVLAWQFVCIKVQMLSI